VSLGVDWKRVKLGLEKSQVRTGQESGWDWKRVSLGLEKSQFRTGKESS
jgi:hypothetical protein